MKNIMIGVISCLLVILLVSTTIPNNNKPAQPKYIVSYYNKADIVNQTIKDYFKQGYIVHQLSYGGYGAEAMVVMYKYY